MKKLIASLLVAVSYFTSTSVSAVGAGLFTDVDQTSPYWTYISDLKNKQVIMGHGDGSFGPKDQLTRAEFSVLVCKAFNLAASDDLLSNFNDVRGHWGEKYISTAYKNGMVYGTSSSTFEPNAKVTREQAATIIWRYLSNHSIAPVKGAPLSVDASEWAKEAVSNIMSYKLHGPDVATTFYRPKDNMTREEVAALIDTSMDKLPPEYHKVIVNPTSNVNNIVSNQDGSKSFGNITAPASYQYKQSIVEVKSHLELVGKIKFSFSGTSVTINVPATGTDSLQWIVQDTKSNEWRGSVAKTITLNDDRGVGVTLYDYDNGHCYAGVGLLYKDGNWVVTYPEE